MWRRNVAMPSGGRPRTPTEYDEDEEPDGERDRDDEPLHQWVLDRRRIDEVLRAERPIGSVVPDLVLPDRHARLQRVDPEPRRCERLGPVRRGHDDEHGRLTELEPAEAVEQHHATRHRPPCP